MLTVLLLGVGRAVDSWHVGSVDSPVSKLVCVLKSEFVKLSFVFNVSNLLNVQVNVIFSQNDSCRVGQLVVGLSTVHGRTRRSTEHSVVRVCLVTIVLVASASSRVTVDAVRDNDVTGRVVQADNV